MGGPFGGNRLLIVWRSTMWVYSQIGRLFITVVSSLLCACSALATEDPCSCPTTWQKRTFLPQTRITGLPQLVDQHPNRECEPKTVPQHGWFGVITIQVDGSNCSNLPWDEPFIPPTPNPRQSLTVIVFPSKSVGACKILKCYVVPVETIYRQCFVCPPTGGEECRTRRETDFDVVQLEDPAPDCQCPPKKEPINPPEFS
jgi:hypothetical protein